MIRGTESMFVRLTDALGWTYASRVTFTWPGRESVVIFHLGMVRP